MGKPGFIVKKLVVAGKLPVFQMLGTVDGPWVFPRNTAALAWLIDRVNKAGAKAIVPVPDPEDPACYDVMVDYGGEVEQYAIEGRT